LRTLACHRSDGTIGLDDVPITIGSAAGEILMDSH